MGVGEPHLRAGGVALFFPLGRRRDRGAREDAGQLALPLEAARALPGADALLDRLRREGVRGITRVVLTRNRSVMVSARDGVLRVHAHFLAAPPEVLRALATFVGGGSRTARAAARRTILAYEVPRAPARRRPTATHPDDARLAARLAALHAELNARHFGGALRPLPVQVSRRLKRRLGHYAPAPLAAGDAPGAAEIAISRRHIRRDGWEEAAQTLLHEMVHQWQDESGLPLDHGPAFRRKAREVGVVPSARRPIDRADRPGER